MSDQGDFLNVLDYYGSPPLSSTYAGAFQMAISAATSSGGIVFMPPGAYDIDADITPVSGIVISGYGATLISTNASVDAAIFSYSVAASPLTNLVIQGFTFDLASNWVSGGAIALGRASLEDVMIRDIQILGSDSGAAWMVALGYIYATNVTDNHSERIHVENCTFSGGITGGTEALILKSCDQLTVSNCHFYDVSTYSSGVDFSQCLGIYGYCNGVAVRGNVFRGCNGSILVQQAQNVTITANIARNGASSSGDNWDVTLRNCESVQVVGNSLQGQTDSKAVVLSDFTGFDGGTVQFANSSGLVIESNLIIGYMYGIYGGPAGSGQTAHQSDVRIRQPIHWQRYQRFFAQYRNADLHS